MAKDAKRAGAERFQLVDINVVAARLGVQVRHVRCLVPRASDPLCEVGPPRPLRSSDIDAWVEQSRIAPSQASQR